MLAKKAPGTGTNSNIALHEKELEYLYARRSAIDGLIRSLQEYDLSIMKWTDFEKRKSA